MNYLSIDPSTRSIAYAVFNENEVLMVGKVNTNLYSLVKEKILENLVKEHDINGIFVETQYGFHSPSQNEDENKSNQDGNIRIAEITGAIYQFCADRDMVFSGIKPYKWQTAILKRFSLACNNYRDLRNNECNNLLSRKETKRISTDFASSVIGKHILDNDMADAVCIAVYSQFLINKGFIKKIKQPRIKHEVVFSKTTLRRSVA